MVALSQMQVVLGDRLALRGSAPRRSILRRACAVKPAAAMHLPSKDEVAKGAAAALASAAILSSTALPAAALNFDDIMSAVPTTPTTEFKAPVTTSKPPSTFAERQAANKAKAEAAKKKAEAAKMQKEKELQKKQQQQRRQKKKSGSGFHPGPIASTIGYGISLSLSSALIAGSALYATGTRDEEAAMDIADDMMARAKSLENKPIVAAYALGALASMACIDAVAHWPVFGWMLSPYLTIASTGALGIAAFRYGTEGASFEEDAKYNIARINDAIPQGLPKLISKKNVPDWAPEGLPGAKPSMNLVETLLEVKDVEIEDVTLSVKESVEAIDEKVGAAIYTCAVVGVIWCAFKVAYFPLFGLIVRPAFHAAGMVSTGLLGLRYLREGGDIVADTKLTAAKLNDAIPEGFPPMLSEETAKAWAATKPAVRSNIVSMGKKVKKSSKEKKTTVSAGSVTEAFASSATEITSKFSASAAEITSKFTKEISEIKEKAIPPPPPKEPKDE